MDFRFQVFGGLPCPIPKLSVYIYVTSKWFGWNYLILWMFLIGWLAGSLDLSCHLFFFRATCHNIHHSFCLNQLLALNWASVSFIDLQHLCSTKTMWWFQTFLIFTPIWGRFSSCLISFRWVETTNQKTIKLELGGVHHTSAILMASFFGIFWGRRNSSGTTGLPSETTS